MADGARFELALGFRPKHTFQACAFNHSATYPWFHLYTCVLLKKQEKNVWYSKDFVSGLELLLQLQLGPHFEDL